MIPGLGADDRLFEYQVNCFNNTTVLPLLKAEKHTEAVLKFLFSRSIVTAGRNRMSYYKVNKMAFTKM